MNIQRIHSLIPILALTILPSAHAQGDPRTAIDSLPYVINHPGSYVLTADLEGTAGSDGILVNSMDVTIDLNGFTLRGVPGSLNGILASDYAHVYGGTLASWGGTGLKSTAVGYFHDIVSRDNLQRGFDVGQCTILLLFTAMRND